MDMSVVRRGLGLCGSLLTLLSVASTSAQVPHPQSPTAPTTLPWTTLGTAGGPPVQPGRSQPANLMLVGGEPWLVDCGDGCIERLSAAGFAPAQVDTLVLSHLHIDHTGGLLGLIGIRWMTRAAHPLVIYGPPGTDQLVAGIVQAMTPTARIGMGIRGEEWGQSVADTVKVVIVRGGDDMAVGGVRMRAVKNSHFADEAGRDADNGSQSLSYRFDQGGYSVGYTGDTGPSAAVATLERGVDLLVSEVIDIDAMEREIMDHYPAMPLAAKRSLILHFRTQHLTAEAAGALATQAKAKRLVLTHLTATGPTASFADRLVAAVQAGFTGPVVVARDLDRF